MYPDINERIKENRKRMGMTQTELGIRLGVQKSAIQKYESGSNHYKLATIIKLTNVFGITVSELIGEPPTVVDERQVMYKRYGAIGIELLEKFEMLNMAGQVKVVIYATDLIPNHSTIETMFGKGEGI